MVAGVFLTILLNIPISECYLFSIASIYCFIVVYAFFLKGNGVSI